MQRPGRQQPQATTSGWNVAMAVSAAQQKPLPFHLNVAAGAAAGGTELMVMYPLDLVKTRMQLRQGAQSKGNVLAGLRRVVAKEGFLALYRGILPPLLVEPMKRAVKFSSNATYKKWVIGDKAATPVTSGLCGAMAGMTECVIIAPFEVVKVRLQSKARKGVYRNTFHCATQIAKHDGLKAFGQGMGPAMWRQASWNGAYFFSIFMLKNKVLPEPEGRAQELGRNFVAGLAGGTLGTTLNTPFDVVTSRMRNVLPGEATRYNTTWQSLRLIAKEEGWTALWKGYVPKLARLGPGGGILLVAFDAFSKVARQNFV